jgi:hypothetical protein
VSPVERLEAALPRRFGCEGDVVGAVPPAHVFARAGGTQRQALNAVQIWVYLLSVALSHGGTAWSSF